MRVATPAPTTPSLGKGPKPRTRTNPSNVFRATALMVIAMVVRESVIERNVAVVTALITVSGAAAANSRRDPAALVTTSSWAPTKRRTVDGKRINGSAVQTPKMAAAV